MPVKLNHLFRQNNMREGKNFDVRHKLTWIKQCRHKCHKCGYVTNGQMFYLTSQPVKSIDGQNAYQVFWFCDNNYHHCIRPGYTRPVDFNLIHGKPPSLEEDAPDYDASDSVWEEYVFEQTKKMEAIKKQMQ